jgi:predicted RecA/RadA family phage recombinase
MRHTAAADLYNGDVIVIGTIGGIAVHDTLSGELAEVDTGNIYRLPQKAETFTAGDAVYWDATGDPVTGTAGTGAATGTATAVLMGTAESATLATDTYVYCRLNAAARTATIAGSVTADDITGSDASLGITGILGVGAGNGGSVLVVGGANAAAGTGDGGAATLAGGAAGGGATGDGGAVTIDGGDSTSTSGSGGDIAITAGLSTGANEGGVITVTAGAGGAAGAGGTLVMAGGAPASGNAAGGLVSYTGGAGSGTGAGGAASLVGGSSGAGATGNGGATAVTGGVAASTAGVGGDVVIAGGGGEAGGTGGDVTIDAGDAGTDGAIAIGCSKATNVTIGAPLNYAAAGGAADVQTLTLAPAVTAYAAGLMIAFRPVADNTGACTINVNGLGAKSIKTQTGADPAAGDLQGTTGLHIAVYDGTNFVLINPGTTTD